MALNWFQRFTCLTKWRTDISCDKNMEYIPLPSKTLCHTFRAYWWVTLLDSKIHINPRVGQTLWDPKLWLAYTVWCFKIKLRFMKGHTLLAFELIPEASPASTGTVLHRERTLVSSGVSAVLVRASILRTSFIKLGPKFQLDLALHRGLLPF